MKWFVILFTAVRMFWRVRRARKTGACAYCEVERWIHEMFLRGYLDTEQRERFLSWINPPSSCGPTFN